VGGLKVWRSQIHWGGLSLYFGARTELTMNRHTLICIVLFSTIAPAQAPQVQRYVVLPPHSQATVLPVLLWGKGSYASWTPSQTDIEDLELKLPQISELKIKGWESTGIRKDHPEKYFRQYVGVKLHGKREIYINAFCDDPPPPDWRTRLYVVIDGDIGYWHAFYDTNKKTFSDLTINYRA